MRSAVVNSWFWGLKYSLNMLKFHFCQCITVSRGFLSLFAWIWILEYLSKPSPLAKRLQGNQSVRTDSIHVNVRWLWKPGTQSQTQEQLNSSWWQHCNMPMERGHPVIWPRNMKPPEKPVPPLFQKSLRFLCEDVPAATGPGYEELSLGWSFFSPPL